MIPKPPLRSTIFHVNLLFLLLSLAYLPLLPRSAHTHAVRPFRIQVRFGFETELPHSCRRIAIYSNPNDHKRRAAFYYVGKHPVRNFSAASGSPVIIVECAVCGERRRFLLLFSSSGSRWAGVCGRRRCVRERSLWFCGGAPGYSRERIF